MSGLGPSFMKMGTYGSSPQSRSRNAWTWIKNVKGASHLSNFWNICSPIQMISCRNCWQWTIPGYITMSQRQSNNQWNGGIAALPTPKHSKCKKLLEKFSPRFLGIKTASSSLIIFQRAKLSTRSISHLCWCSWRTFWRKNTAGSWPRQSCSCTSVLQLTGHLQPRRNWPTWASKVFITHPILGFGLVGLPPVPWTEKTIERSLFFVRRGGHCYRGDQVVRTNFWFFRGSGLPKLEQRAKKCIELRGDYIE